MVPQQVHWFVISHNFAIMRNVRELGAFHKQRNRVGFEGAEGSRNLRNLHILQCELNLLRLDKDVIDHCCVFILHLIVIQFGDVLLGEGMDQERSDKGEEAKEGTSSNNNSSIGLDTSIAIF